MTIWTAKDPDAVQDYVYAIPLDAGDSVASHVFELLTGTVVIDDEDRTGANVTVWLSGGVDGETSVFRIEWVTVAGREDDDVITLAVINNEYEPLVLTGYVKPSPPHLTTRYPAFADVERATIAYWLTDAERSVDTSWMEGDYAAALMALAAHNMTLAGLGSEAGAIGSIPAGVTSMKSGSLSLSFSGDAVMDHIAGAFSSTRYGAEYAALLRRNKGGPRAMATGALPYDPMRYPMGET